MLRSWCDCLTRNITMNTMYITNRKRTLKYSLTYGSIVYHIAMWSISLIIENTCGLIHHILNLVYRGLLADIIFIKDIAEGVEVNIALSLIYPQVIRLLNNIFFKLWLWQLIHQGKHSTVNVGRASCTVPYWWRLPAIVVLSIATHWWIMVLTDPLQTTIMNLHYCGCLK